MTLRTLCEKHPNDYIRLDFWSMREKISLGYDLLSTEDDEILEWEVWAEYSGADYYDIDALLI